MFKKFLAGLATLAIGLGLAATAAVGPALATPAINTNDPSEWVVGAETCAKVDFSDPKPSSLSYSDLTSLFSISGKTLTKVVIKSGSSGHGGVVYENTAYYADAAFKLAIADTSWVGPVNLTTTTFTHVSGKDISHVIVCYTTPPSTTSVSGSVNKDSQTCDDDDEYVSGWIEPVATEGVTYALYKSDKTTPEALVFTGRVDVAPGTYWVLVSTTDAALYTVSEANMWIEVVVGAYDGDCSEVEPESVSGSVNKSSQMCDDTYEYVSGWIAPVATTGVKYELYESDKTTEVAVPFTGSVDVAPGTYFVKVISTDTTLYTVSEANMWIEVVVGGYDGTCSNLVKTIGDPVAFQECVAPSDQLDPVSEWVATLTISTSGSEPAGSVKYRVYFWDGSDWIDQGIWAEGTYNAGPGGDIPYGTKVKVVAEAVAPYQIQTPTEWEYDFIQPFDCDLPTGGTVTPVVTFAQSCENGPTYTLSIEGGVEGTVLWSVNGGPQTTQLGTFPAPSSAVTVVAVPGPESGFEGEGEDALQRDFTHEYPALDACGDLTTLALTGNNVAGVLWLAGLLGLVGVALVRASNRAAASRTES